MNMIVLQIGPRLRRMVSKPEMMRTAMFASVAAGLGEGLALVALLPAISALADDAPVWGLGIGGWLWVLVGLALVSFAVHYLQTNLNYKVALDFLRSIHRLIGDQVAKQPLGWFDKPLAGSLSRMVSVELVNAGQIFAHMLGPFQGRVTTALVVIVGAWFWNPWLGLILTVAAPLFFVITLLSTYLLRRGKSRHEPAEVILADRIVEYAQCQGALRSCGRSDDFEPLQTAFEDANKTKRSALWLETFGLLLSGVATQVIVVILIGVTGSLAVAGSLEPIPALAFMGLALRFSTVVSAITENVMGLESNRQMLDALDEVLTAEPLPEPVKPTVLPEPGTIRFEDVTFGYSSSVPILKHFSMTVPAGSMVALVGPSGSGKTTIARLISRFYDIDDGEIFVGGSAISKQTSQQLMQQLSMVFQDVYLFDDTLEANVAVGREGASEEEIREAADLAGVTEIAERLPDGWQSQVGEGGRALSGGERQRVAIARALLKQAPIVLLDEATSALDVENEEHVIAAIEQLRQHATVLVIAHRIDTIARADQVIALDGQGGVEAQGTHQQLLASDGTYARYWEHLNSAEGWQLVGSS